MQSTQSSMQFVYMLRLASKNLLRHRLRSLLTMAGIAVAIVSFGLLRTVVDSWYAGAELGSAGRLITRSEASLSFRLPVTHADRIRRVPGVSAVTWANWFGGVYIDEKHFFPQYAIDAASYFGLYPEYVIAPDQLSAFQRERRAVIVGRKLANKNGWQLGDSVALRGTVYPGTWNFVIRGIYTGADDKTDEGLFLMHWQYLNERVKAILPSMADSVGIFIVGLHNSNDSAEVSAAIDSVFRNSLAETRTETQKAFQLGFIAMVDTILVAIKTVAYVVVLIIMAVMANTMAMSTRERRREYATLKAVGFGPRYLLALILGESLALSIGSGILGILAAFPAAGLLAAKFGTLFPVFEISSRTIQFGLFASCLIGLTAAVFPAWRVITFPVSEGLRSIG